jgi:hypothetical protein
VAIRNMEFDMTTNAIGYIPTYVLQNNFYVDNDKQRPVEVS